MDQAAYESLAGLSTVDKAVELRRRHICNCCQAVVAAIHNDPQLLNAASGFGGGMMGGMHQGNGMGQAPDQDFAGSGTTPHGSGMGPGSGGGMPRAGSNTTAAG